MCSASSLQPRSQKRGLHCNGTIISAKSTSATNSSLCKILLIKDMNGFFGALRLSAVYVIGGMCRKRCLGQLIKESGDVDTWMRIA